MVSEKQKNQLPRAALDQLADAAKEVSAKAKGKTAMEIFKRYLTLMDKYRDYFFNEPWPKKWDINRAITFTSEDLEFIDEKEDEYVDRVLTVFMKKNISLKGFNTFGIFWTEQAYHKRFIKPELKRVYEAFKELAKTGISAQEVLTKLKEQEDVSFVHLSLVELLKDESLDQPLDLKVAEVLELIHTKEGDECEEEQCKRQREKLKNKPN